MKEFYCMIFLSLMSLVLGQEIKIKKNEVQIDGNTVAFIEKEKDLLFEITDAKDRSKKIIMHFEQEPYKSNELDGEKHESYFIVSVPGNEIKNDLNFVGNYWNKKKSSVSMLYETHSFLDENGLKMDEINEFLSVKRERELSDVAQQILDEKVRIKYYDPYINDNKIYKGGANGEMVGFIRKVGSTTQIFDMDTIKIATFMINKEKSLETVQIINQKTQELKHSKFPDIQKVNYLIAHGYPLGKDMKIRISEENLAQYESLGNFRDQPGMIDFYDGHTLKGLITLEYSDQHQLPPLTKFRSPGGDAYIRYENNVGDKLSRTIPAHKGKKIILDNGKQYIGSAADGESLTVITNSMYYEIVDETDRTYILKDPLQKDVYAVLVKGQIFAIAMKPLGPKKFQNVLDKRMECDFIKGSNYDTSTYEGIKKLVKDYEENCPKKSVE